MDIENLYNGIYNKLNRWYG